MICIFNFLNLNHHTYLSMPLVLTSVQATFAVSPVNVTSVVVGCIADSFAKGSGRIDYV